MSVVLTVQPVSMHQLNTTFLCSDIIKYAFSRALSPSSFVFFKREQKSAALSHQETGTIKILFLLALIMPFSSLVANSSAVYNFPHESYNYQSSVNGPV